jgi:hypothetical protein
MTMYLPNDDVRPTGYEAGEFIEDPILADDAEPIGRPADGPDPDHRDIR